MSRVISFLSRIFRHLISREQDGWELRVKPRADWILFKAVVIERKSGIVASEGARLDQDLVKNIVRDVGPGVFGVSAGDEIILLPHARLKVNLPGRGAEPDLFLVKEVEVCAIIKSK